jgi:ferredoxin-type protein NapH
MRRYRYLTARRLTQISVMFLFFTGNAYGWTILRGNLSSARVLDVVPLSDPFAVLQSFSAGADISKDIIIGALIISAIYAAIGGRLFCGWVCPLNIVTDTANRLRRFLKIDIILKQWEIKRVTRYWVIALALILSSLLGIAAFEWLSPIGALQRGIVFGMGFGWAYITAVFLFDLFAVKNGFCGHICPLGGVYSLLGRYGILRVRHYRDNCTHCMRCLDICPEKQVLHMVGKESGAVLSGECLNCGRCIEVCDDNAMRFRNIYSKQRFNN